MPVHTDLVPVKISKLEGFALDWAVHIACGLDPECGAYSTKPYSAEWSCIGPLISEMRMTFATFGTGQAVSGIGAEDFPIIAIPGIRGKYHASEGPTHLVAACRCYVLAKMSMDADGEVMIPAALVTQ